MSHPDWEHAPTFEGVASISARNGNEAYLFIDVHGGTVLDTRIANGHFEVLARVGRSAVRFPFFLKAAIPPEPNDFGEGLSEILDPVDLLLYADRVEREMPEVPPEVGRGSGAARRLRMAAGALRLAVRFVSAPGGLSPDMLRNRFSQIYAAAFPERLKPEPMLAAAAQLDARAPRWDLPYIRPYVMDSY